MRVATPAIRKARIEIVPMIDTIFFLLVFFMMSTLSMVKMQGLHLAIPKDSLTSHKRTPERITLSVSPTGNYLLDKQSVTVEQLSDKFKSDLAAHPDAVVVLNLAPTQKTQTLISTMDILNEIMTRAGNQNPILVATNLAHPSSTESSKER